MKYLRLLLLLPILIAFQNCSDVFEDPLAGVDLPALKVTGRKFQSCDEFSTWKEERKARYKEVSQRYYDSMSRGGRSFVSSNQASSAPVTSSPVSITNNQEAGVDEADIFKADASYMYYARMASVEVIDKVTLKSVQTVAVPGLEQINIFVEGGRLLVMGLSENRNAVVLRSFVRQGGKLVQENERRFQGNYVSARLNAGRVLIVLKANSDGLTAAAGSTEILNVPCERIMRAFVDDFDFNITTVHQIQADTFKTESLALPGRADHIYVSEQNLYVLAGGYSWFHWDTRLTNHLLWQSHVILKVNIAEHAPEFRAAGLVTGRIKDVWAMKERGEKFHIATSYSRDGQRQNGLFTLRENGMHLKVTGRSVEYGKNEDIRAVRYIGDKAYVVTFFTTDPLFTFDLSADQPRLLSHLEIPGFSAYLHPAGEGRLLGVGFGGGGRGGSGLQLSLFDIRDPLRVSVLHQIELGSGASGAEVASDHHAFHFSNGIAAVPVTIYQGYQSSFSGAILFSTNNTLAEAGRISHRDLTPVGCHSSQRQFFWGWSQTRNRPMDVGRLTEVGGLLVAVSPFGITLSDPARGYAVVRAEKFADPEGECDRMHFDRSNYYW